MFATYLHLGTLIKLCYLKCQDGIAVGRVTNFEARNNLCVNIFNVMGY